MNASEWWEYRFNKGRTRQEVIEDAMSDRTRRWSRLVYRTRVLLRRLTSLLCLHHKTYLERSSATYYSGSSPRRVWVCQKCNKTGVTTPK